MNKLERIALIAVASLLVALVIFAAGCQRGKRSVKPPEVQTQTITTYDSLPHYIFLSGYTSKPDTVIYTNTIPANVDTAAIIKEYFAKNILFRQWTDSEISITLSDTISQNKPLSQQLVYKILRPQTITNNTTINRINNRYVYGGIGMNTVDLKLSSLDLTIANPRWYGAVGWMPGVKGLNLRAGITLFTFKKTVR